MFDVNVRPKCVSPMAWLATSLFLFGGYAVAQPTALCLEQKLVAFDAATGDYTGRSVLISGDTAFVAASSDDHAGAGSCCPNAGSVYVHVRSGGVWSYHQKLIASDPSTDAYFGNSLALSGDTLFIGADGDSHVVPNAGSVYVFVNSGGTWTEQQKLVASDAMATAGGSYFGSDVDASGDTLVVSARDAVYGGIDSGAVYVFSLTGTTWAEQEILVPSDAYVTLFGWDFGASVALSGDTLMIGAPGDPLTGSGTEAGSVYEFHRSGGTFTEQLKLLPSAGFFSFGNHMSMSGDTVAVSGSPGMAVFDRSGGSWAPQPVALSGTGTYATDLVVSGDTLVVGFQSAFISGVIFAGAVDVCTRSGGAWTSQETLVAPVPHTYGLFGSGVSLSGDTVLIGSFGDPLGGALPFAGAAYVYTSPPPCGSGACLDVAGNPGIGDSLSLSLQSPSANSPCYVLASTSVVPGGYSVNFGGASYLLHVALGQPGVIPFADPSNTFGQSLSNPMTDANGLWCYAFEVPNDPALVGVTFYAEAFVISAAGSLVSNLESVTIQ